jgi:hypothetical protein
VGARDGFEVVYFSAGSDDGLVIDGHTTAIEDGEPFDVGYSIVLDAQWRTRSGLMSGRSRTGRRSTRIEADGAGNWTIDGEPAPDLTGCLDLDLESSALTNAFPVHRLRLRPGAAADAPAAYVRAPDLRAGRLEQRYRRSDDGTGPERYDYAAPAFGFTCELVYDDAGLVVDYPGLAVRAAAA